MHGNDSFGFVDPKDILRGCHILPNLAKGKRHGDGVGISRCAKDGKDYKEYYIRRFSERDLFMRYHWGLGIGHFHAHQATLPSGHTAALPDDTELEDCQCSDFEPEKPPCELQSGRARNGGDSDTCGESDNSELGFEAWEDVPVETDDDSSECGDYDGYRPEDMESEKDFRGV